MGGRVNGCVVDVCPGIEQHSNDLEVTIVARPVHWRVTNPAAAVDRKWIKFDVLARPI